MQWIIYSKKIAFFENISGADESDSPTLGADA
jgi:hypothetical protein